MGWRTLQLGDVTSRFTAAEQAMLVAAGGAGSALATRLNDSVQKFLGAMVAAGYSTGAGGAVPDQLRNHVMADAAWEWIKDFPTLKALATDLRKKAAADAEAAYEKICLRTYGAIEKPRDNKVGGNWNSRPKLMMRTDPVPSPLNQLQLAPTNVYANPEGPTDAGSGGNTN